MQGNRISPPSRWPANLDDVIERAERDMDFVRCMRQLGYDSQALGRIFAKAARMLDNTKKRGNSGNRDDD